MYEERFLDGETLAEFGLICLMGDREEDVYVDWEIPSETAGGPITGTKELAKLGGI